MSVLQKLHQMAFSDCFHLVKMFLYALALSDPIKRRLLFVKEILQKKFKIVRVRKNNRIGSLQFYNSKSSISCLFLQQ